MKPRISAVINTLNEETNIPHVLGSICTWVDEMIVVDMHSEDRTVEIARELGARVYFHERIGFVEGARAFAVEQATGDWILLLDADEMVPQPLSLELLKIAAEDSADIVVIPWLNYLLGAPLRHTGWGPDQDPHPRFFKKGHLSLTPEIHLGIHFGLGSRVLTLPSDGDALVHHFNYLDGAHFLQKLNRYTTVEAQQAFERGETVTMLEALRRSSYEFLHRYLYRRGFRDGWRGFYLSGYMAMYRFTICAKLEELRSSGNRDEIIARYNRTAKDLIGAYFPRD